jgi:hypothetical protein
MSVYIVIHDENAYERFIGLFSTLELAQKVVNESPIYSGYLDIRKIDMDKLYFTDVSCCNIKTCTELGTRVSCVEKSYGSQKELSDELKNMLHEDNDFENFYNEQSEFREEMMDEECNSCQDEPGEDVLEQDVDYETQHLNFLKAKLEILLKEGLERRIVYIGKKPYLVCLRRGCGDCINCTGELANEEYTEINPKHDDHDDHDYTEQE